MALAEFDLKDNTLTLDAITHNGVEYDNVVVRITGYEIISFGASRPTKDAVCPEAFTAMQYDHIRVGMTMDQVDDVIGCNYDVDGTEISGNNILRNWETSGNILREIFVNFDTTTNLVAPDASGTFKRKIGF